MNNHPLFFIYSCIKKRMVSNEPIKWFLVAVPFIFLLFLRSISDICPCTLFAIACFLQLLLVVTMTGRFATTGIVGEREKKTLDSLRLTSIGPVGIVIGKLLPEFFELSRVILVTSPFLLLLGWSFSGTGFITPLLATGISICAGITMVCGLTCLSSYSSTVSSAIVMSWVLRFVWLFLTPLIDNLFAAILVRPSTIPVISSLNPAVPLLAVSMPGSLDGSAWHGAAYIYPFIVPVFCFLSIVFSARQIETGDKASGITRNKTLEFFSPGSIADSLSGYVSIFKNPLFLKEIVSFRRDLVGLIPGVMVFAVPLLAPYFYCLNTDIKIFDITNNHINRSVIVKPVSHQIIPTDVSDVNVQDDSIKDPGISITNSRGETFMLPGHKEYYCLRLMLYEYIALPLPVMSDTFVASNQSQQADINCQQIQQADINCQQRQQFSYNNNHITNRSTGQYSVYGNLSSTSVNHSVSQMPNRAPVEHLGETYEILLAGFYMSVILLLIYLVFRSSSFLCSTYNTEKNKLTWDLLMLTQLKPSDIINGKLWGALFMPFVQMTIGFLAIFFWIYKGVITFQAGVGFYVFCIAVALVAGLLGQYNSITSPSAHVSQGKTIARSFILSFLFPSAVYLLLVIMYMIGIPVRLTNFIFTPFLVTSPCIITLSPFNFILTMGLLAGLGYILWSNIKNKLQKELNL